MAIFRFSPLRLSIAVVTLVGGIGLLAACSDDDTDNAVNPQDGGADSSQADAAHPDAAAADSAVADAGNDAADAADATVAVRCTQAEFDATDHTMTSGVDITFPTTAAPAQYGQHCAKVKVGQHVGFYGDFSMHPLEPNGGDTPTFITAKSTGTTLDLTATAVGTYGFQCSSHPGTMFGAVQVVP
ncbi:MAG: hypothetical protein JWP97_373 [Labilithrix sp.]|nr:hypothetical protein [Labilithrix sp.]